MATQAKAKPAAKKAVVKETQIETPVVETKAPAKPKWEIKDRVYLLSNGKSPITYTIKSRGIYWFDDELGYERELKYTTNQRTPFVDEFKGDARLGHIVFEDGVLRVPKEKTILQQLLSLYHPDKGRKYYEYDPEAEAEDELDLIELEIEALTLAGQIDIDHAEAIMRAELGNKVSKMSSKELKRDMLLFAKQEPELFLELANDENIRVRNIGVKAVEAAIIKLSSDQRTFTWGSTGRKLLTVPFDENPYSALAAWFKTDDGIEVFQQIEKRLN